MNYLVIYLYMDDVSPINTHTMSSVFAVALRSIFFLLVFALHNMFTHIFRMQNILKIDITSLKIILSDRTHDTADG